MYNNFEANVMIQVRSADQNEIGVLRSERCKKNLAEKISIMFNSPF